MRRLPADALDSMVPGRYCSRSSCKRAAGVSGTYLPKVAARAALGEITNSTPTEEEKAPARGRDGAAGGQRAAARHEGRTSRRTRRRAEAGRRAASARAGPPTARRRRRARPTRAALLLPIAPTGCRVQCAPPKSWPRPTLQVGRRHASHAVSAWRGRACPELSPASYAAISSARSLRVSSRAAERDVFHRTTNTLWYNASTAARRVATHARHGVTRAGYCSAPLTAP